MLRCQVTDTIKLDCHCSELFPAANEKKMFYKYNIKFVLNIDGLFSGPKKCQSFHAQTKFLARGTQLKRLTDYVTGKISRQRTLSNGTLIGTPEYY